LPRSIALCLIAFVLFVCPFALYGQQASTHCLESEVSLDANHTSSRLGRCGDDISTELLWHLDRIDQIVPSLDGHFDRHNGGAGSVIYVMDTGVMAQHTEFIGADGASRVIAGYDATASVAIGRSHCVSGDRALDPCYADFDELPSASHGTSVASLAAGKNVGVAPEARIVSIRVMNEHGLATTRTYSDGLDAIIRYAWLPSSPATHTSIVNISGWVLERLGSASSSSSVVTYASVEKKMRNMIAGVDAKGNPDPNGKRFLFVVAANNLDGGCGESGMIDRFPAILGHSIPGMITVGGMTESNTSWVGTCRGGVEVLAPSQSIYSATITAPDEYRGRRPNLRNGTSFAAPIISGIAARLLSERPDLTPEQIEGWITATPSRVDDASALLADGKVAYVRSIAPAAGTSVATRATYEP
jgi:subtilisin family serine protease